MDQTFIIILSLFILFYNKTDCFDQNSKFLAGARIRSFGRVSDSLATLKKQGDTSLEKMSSRIEKGVQRTESWESREDTTGKKLPVVWSKQFASGGDHRSLLLDRIDIVKFHFIL